MERAKQQQCIVIVFASSLFSICSRAEYMEQKRAAGHIRIPWINTAKRERNYAGGGERTGEQSKSKPAETMRT